MTTQISQNNKRIAKNTLLLYIRLLLTLCVGLYTSRVVLQTLGVQDYGVYNVVAGFVSMFSLLTGSLSNAISRYFTFTLGKDDIQRLKIVFSTSVIIQLALAILVAAITELFGLWFLNSKLNIPATRMIAANWVFHFSVLSFVINLVSIPYNACIIAHEKMDVFTYISVLETILKLTIVFMLVISPFDKLISYTILFVFVSIVIRMIYGVYCKRKFEECVFSWSFDKNLLKEMMGFASWNLLGSASMVLNNQGVNVIINIFFGVTVNAARGVTNQVEGIVKQFVTNFTTAINPQIVKSYASGNYSYMNTLIINGAKYSVCLMLIFTIPFLFETENILKLWLGKYPTYAPIFLRLALIGSIVDMSGNSLANAVWASGNIKKYYIYIGALGLMTIPLTYILFLIGFPPFYSYISYIIAYFVIQIVRLFIAKSEIPFQILPYVKDVYIKTLAIAIIPIVITYIPYRFLYEGFVKTFIIIVLSILICILSIYKIGLGVSEKAFVKSKILNLFNKNAANN